MADDNTQPPNESEEVPSQQKTDDHWAIYELHPYEIEDMLEHFCLRRFPFLMIYDGDAKQYQDDFPGRLLDEYTLESKIIVSMYEYAVIIRIGERSFYSYGNFSAMLNAIKEVYATTISSKLWNQIEHIASHKQYADIAWAVGRLHELRVSERPSHKALAIAERLVEWRIGFPKKHSPR